MFRPLCFSFLILSMFSALANAGAPNFADSWTPVTNFEITNTRLYKHKRIKDMTMLIRKDRADAPALNMDLAPVKEAIDAYRTATQKLMGFGKFRTEQLFIRQYKP